MACCYLIAQVICVLFSIITSRDILGDRVSITLGAEGLGLGWNKAVYFGFLCKYVIPKWKLLNVSYHLWYKFFKLQLFINKMSKMPEIGDQVNNSLIHNYY